LLEREESVLWVMVTQNSMYAGRIGQEILTKVYSAKRSLKWHEKLFPLQHVFHNKKLTFSQVTLTKNLLLETSFKVKLDEYE